MVETATQKPQDIQVKQTALESKMDYKPMYDDKDYYKGSEKLRGKFALITGGDSGIGRSICVLFAREKCDVAIVYRQNEKEDADLTRKLVEQEGQKCILVPGDVADMNFCNDAIKRALSQCGRDSLDILINNAGIARFHENVEDIGLDDMKAIFDVNVFGMFNMTKACLPFMKDNNSCSIINTASIGAYTGLATHIDYAATSGSVVAFTRSLALNLVRRGIRVNCVAPGPIITPMLQTAYPSDKIDSFGKKCPMGRPGQPFECATSFVFLASRDSTYFTGQVLHPNGGQIVNA
jgi:NAD(P)-dependent dehydrogenase (short-subunit alcohol dehydrogenase family)